VPLGCQIQAGFVGGRAGHIWGYVVPGHGNSSTNQVPMPKNNITPSGPALPLTHKVVKFLLCPRTQHNPLPAHAHPRNPNFSCICLYLSSR